MYFLLFFQNLLPGPVGVLSGFVGGCGGIGLGVGALLGPGLGCSSSNVSSEVCNGGSGGIMMCKLVQ